MPYALCLDDALPLNIELIPHDNRTHKQCQILCILNSAVKEVVRDGCLMSMFFIDKQRCVGLLIFIQQIGFYA